MASGLKTELKYDYGICGECEYTVEQLVEEYPQGSSDLEATGKIIHAGSEIFLIVIPHRNGCSLHTSHSKELYTSSTDDKAIDQSYLDRESGCNGY